MEGDISCFLSLEVEHVFEPFINLTSFSFNGYRGKNGTRS